jgi:hypothetical protein
LEACTSIVNQDQAFGVGFSNERLIVYEAKRNSKWIGYVMKRSTEVSRVRD